MEFKNSSTKPKDHEIKHPAYLQDILNDSVWKKTPQNRKLFSFEKSFGASSSGKKPMCYSTKHDISSFEQESEGNLESHEKAQKVLSEKKPSFNTENEKGGVFLGKRQLADESCCGHQVKSEDSANATSTCSQTFGGKRGVDFILNLYTKDDFQSDSEQCYEEQLFLSKADIAYITSSEFNLTFQAMAKDIHKLPHVPLKKVLDFSFTEAKLFESKLRRAYICKYCTAVFHSGCALGGHISKIHRGVNFTYAQKMAQRSELKTERERIKYLKQLITSK
jgi:hypothetical protein